MKKYLALLLCILLTLASPLGVVAWAETPGAAEAAEAAPPTTYTHDGRVTLIDGAVVDTPVDGFEAAAAVVDSVLDQLGGDERTELDPWRDLTDACGNHYYVFQQMCNDTTVLGGAVKVIADGEGKMLGLTSSIVSELPETQAAEGITAEAAEQIVLDYVKETQQQELNVLEGFTDRMILPTILNLDDDTEADNTSRYVWVVYTENPESKIDRSADLPWLAHYVTMSGEYLYSLSTIIPGDEAGKSGFDSSYVFEFMEPVDYTGYVDLSTGGELEVSVTVMRDKRTGMYYLGNLERRIVVADCWEFLYNDGRVVLESSPDNLEWDQTGLLTLYNYCRAYDYYRAIGWIGGDGLGTPIMVLNNYCDMNHKPVDNAAYVGGYMGWQLFLASSGNDFSQCLDALAHEFTHCVTGSVMTYNAYMNDYGAINEAMSDIQGKTCQFLMEGAENTTWAIGDKAASPLRYMDEPHHGQQPEFTWDAYYMPNVKTPTILNDQGGVHTNSSLLNNLAWRLYEKGGMTFEEGRAFWFAVDCAMVPGTDYPQLAELLPVVLKAAGLEQYDTELRRALDAIRLGVDAIPDTFDADRALLTLYLPENELFDDGQWIMQLYTVNVDKIVLKATEIVTHVMAGDYSVLPPFAQEMMKSKAEEVSEAKDKKKGGLFGALMDALLSAFDENENAPAEVDAKTDEDADILSQVDSEFVAWLRENFNGVVYMANANAGQDGHTMRTVSLPGYALPTLLHGIYNTETSSLDDAHMLIYFGGHWFDLSAIGKKMDEAEAADNPEIKAMMDIVERVIDNFGNIHSYNDVLDMLFFRIDSGKNNDLPATGLDAVKPGVLDMNPSVQEDEALPQPKKSRPKLDDAQAAA